jgi:hypothetical protein
LKKRVNFFWTAYHHYSIGNKFFLQLEGTV